MSIAPIYSKRIKFSGAPSGGVGQTHSPGTMQSSSTLIRWQGHVGRISESEKVSLSNDIIKCNANVTYSV